LAPPRNWGKRAVGFELNPSVLRNVGRSLDVPPPPDGQRMTAEVAVLNKFGVAIAADSAVTVDHWHQNEIKTKVYHTANKLFTLSKYEPVGIMLYNAVTLGGIPWETLIKCYRKHLGKNKFTNTAQVFSVG